MFEKRRIAALARRLAAIRPDPVRYPDDPFGVATLAEALEAVRNDNYGIGALVVDDGGHVIVRAHNRVHADGFHSDLHAEMVVVNAIESMSPPPPAARLTLYTSLEPCPMCLARLKLAGIGTVRYLADDPDGGMVHLANGLPPIWQRLHPDQRFEPARVSPTLRSLAWKIFLSNIRKMRRRLVDSASR